MCWWWICLFIYLYLFKSLYTPHSLSLRWLTLLTIWPSEAYHVTTIPSSPSCQKRYLKQKCLLHLFLQITLKYISYKRLCLHNCHNSLTSESMINIGFGASLRWWAGSYLKDHFSWYFHTSISPNIFFF